jgi:translation initiation factor 2 subunit 1
MVAKQLGITVEQCYNEFANDLIKKYGSLYAAFEESAYDADVLKNDGFKGEWIKNFKDVAKTSISIPFVDIKGYLSVTSWLSDGVNHIRDVLIEAEKTEYEDVEIKIKYIGAPKYMISVKAPDYKIAEEEMKKAVDKVDSTIKKYYGDCEFHRKLEE